MTIVIENYLNYDENKKENAQRLSKKNTNPNRPR